ncbi:hypothetical protein AB4302_08335 [Vibrio breoganii]
MKNIFLLKEFGLDAHQYERCLAVESVSQAIVFGSLDLYLRSFESPSMLPVYLRPLLPARKVVKRCGLSLWVLDKYKARELREKLGVEPNIRAHADKLAKNLVSHSFKVGKRYEEYLVARQKIVRTLSDEFCEVSLGRCQCKEVNRVPKEPVRGTSIGLGVMPVTEIKRVKSSEVRIDINTMPIEPPVKHHLYTEGWSLAGAFTKS